MAEPERAETVPFWFYAGAALGPFAGGVIGVVIPALRSDFAADLGALSWAIPAYMLPFAGLQLVSGAISDATSRRLALGIGFLGFALTSALCGLAPSITWFLVGRVGQGSANAFTTAVLTAALADLVPRERLGRAIGVFSSVNVAGSFAAPMIGGLLATLDWRLVYAAVALLSAGLWLLYDRWLRRLPGRSNVVMPSPRQLAASALDRRLLLFGGLALLANFAIGGSSYLWPTYLEDRWGLALAQAGLIASAFGLAGALAAPTAGRWCDRRGPLVVALVASATGAVGGLALAAAPSPPLFLAALVVQGVAHGAIWTAVSSAVMFAVPDARHRGTAASVNSTFKFAGTALAPAAYTPVYGLAPSAIFVVAAAGALALATAVAASADRLAGKDVSATR
ncbi:MAG TPA: MFS transporter [Chloroflexota bacterium]|nr:MFS transporter [Chloroflexota bacterium]